MGWTGHFSRRMVTIPDDKEPAGMKELDMQGRPSLMTERLNHARSIKVLVRTFALPV